MAGTFAHHRKAPHNKCYGVEFECIMPLDTAPMGAIVDDLFFGGDGSIDEDDYHKEEGVEIVTQPLDYAAVRRTLKKIKKYKHYVNSSCGIHVHVGRGICSVKTANKIAEELELLKDREMKKLFGRNPVEDICDNSGYVGYHRALQDHDDKPTTEFRMFCSGDYKWARECVRRTRLLCEMKKPRTYQNIKEAFGI